jgi:hypothetical protein
VGDARRRPGRSTNHGVAGHVQDTAPDLRTLAQSNTYTVHG